MPLYTQIPLSAFALLNPASLLETEKLSKSTQALIKSIAERAERDRRRIGCMSLQQFLVQLSPEAVRDIKSFNLDLSYQRDLAARMPLSADSITHSSI